MIQRECKAGNLAHRFLNIDYVSFLWGWVHHGNVTKRWLIVFHSYTDSQFFCMVCDIFSYHTWLTFNASGWLFTCKSSLKHIKGVTLGNTEQYLPWKHCHSVKFINILQITEHLLSLSLFHSNHSCVSNNVHSIICYLIGTY